MDTFPSRSSDAVVPMPSGTNWHWQGRRVIRRCGWCKRQMRFGDETHTAYGAPIPDAQAWPSTDGICNDCQRRSRRLAH